jgi:hypothetical protein
MEIGRGAAAACRDGAVASRLCRGRAVCSGLTGQKDGFLALGALGLRCCGRVVGSTSSASSDNQEPPPKKGPPQQRPRKENGAAAQLVQWV